MHAATKTTTHIATGGGRAMLRLQDVTTARPRSSNVTSSAIIAHDRDEVREPIIDYAAERKQSKLRGLWRIIGLWRRRRNDRAILRSLGPRDIHDFCLSQTDADTEMNKPFWRA